MQIFIFIIGLLIPLAEAKITYLPTDKPFIELSTPTGYKLHKDFLGLPWVFIEEGNENNRSSLAISISGISNIDLDSKLLKENYKQYEDGRRTWAMKSGATIKKFLPYESIKNSQQKEIHSGGHIYQNDKGTFYERTFYAECPKTMINLKILIDVSKTAKLNELISSVKSLRCL
jgi:hypothetical protein